MLQDQESVRFGLYTADLRAAELRKGRDHVPLQNLPFRILTVLLREPGRVVTREELRRELWPEDTFVDFERGISTAVSKLREALGDAASNPRFIETVGRRGYRFIAPVSHPAPAQPAAPTTDREEGVSKQLPERVPPSTSRRQIFRRIIFPVIAILTIAALLLAFNSIARTEPPRVLRMVRLTNSGKAENAGGLYSDGSRMYFSEKQGPNWSLMETSLAGGDAVPVATPFPNTRLMAISPDHTEMLITIVANHLGKHPLWIVPIQGGTPHRVGEITVDHAGWFPDGQRILCSSDGEVFSVDRDGAQRHHLFKVNGTALRFAWKPDGSVFRFAVYGDNDTITLWDAFADGTNVHPVLPGWNDPPDECCGGWSADGKSYVFRSVQKGQEDLWLLREPEGWPWSGKPKPIRLTNGPTSFSEPVFSPDGKRIFALGRDRRDVVQRIDQQKGDYIPLPLPPTAFDLDFSPDGQWVAYIATPGLTLWRSRVDGSDRLQLTSAPIDALRPRWSPDSKQIAVVARRPGEYYHGYTLPIDGGALKPVIDGDTLYRWYIDWSRDGESVVLDVAPAMDSRLPITKVNLRTHEISELPGSKGMRIPRWSPNGRYIVASSDDYTRVFLYDTHTLKWKQIGTANQVYKFERDHDDLYFQDVRDPGQAVFRIDPTTGRSERVLDFSKFIRDGAMLCAFQGRAPDGSFVVSVRSAWSNLYAFDVELH